MKKILLCLMVVALAVMTSCSSVRVVPQAKSTVNAVSLSELRLTNQDYSVLNTISAEATIHVTYHTDYSIEVRDAENTFSYKLRPMGKKGEGGFVLDNTDGVIRVGFLSNTPGGVDLTVPEDVSIAVSLYRIIGMSQQMGADGLIEPVISTNIEGSSGSFGKMNVIYKTTVSAKPVKLKVTGK